MKLDITKWSQEILDKIKNSFCTRLLFAGLQGSYSRGEAQENSDIDIVVILDKVDLNDLKTYRKIISSMPFNEKACGFISGKKEIQNWSKSDLFQFWYETKPLLGNMSDIISAPEKKDIKNAVIAGVQNLYHCAVHSFLYDEDTKSSLEALYKMTFFILQQKYFCNNNVYIATKKELLNKLTGIDKEILQICINKENIKNRNDKETDNLYEKLIDWCSSNFVDTP